MKGQEHLWRRENLNGTVKVGERSKSDPLQWAAYKHPAPLCVGDARVAWRLLDTAVIVQKTMDEDKESIISLYIRSILHRPLGRPRTLVLVVLLFKRTSRTTKKADSGVYSHLIANNRKGL